MQSTALKSMLGAAAVVLLAMQPAWAQSPAPAEKPNILVIWGDDIGITNISYNNKGLMGYQTPNIDRIAKEGLSFTDYYGQQSCTAGRAAFIGGNIADVGETGGEEMDVERFTLGLFYRFGDLEETMPVAAAAPVAAVAAVPTKCADADNDGVCDSADRTQLLGAVGAVEVTSITMACGFNHMGRFSTRDGKRDTCWERTSC